MKKMITPISLTKVPTLEFPELAETLVRIVDQYGAETMFIKDTVDALKERVPAVEAMKVNDRKHPESEVIQTLFAKRRDILQAMVRQTKAEQKANLSSQAAQLRLVVPFIEKFWNDVRSLNEKTINSSMKQMLGEVSTIEEIKLAFDSLSLTVYLTELRTIETTLFNSREKRRKSKSIEPKLDSRQVRVNVSETITDLVQAIELARKAHPEVDYIAMIAEINELFTSYQSGIKAHSTRVKTANSKKDKPAAPAA